MLSLKRWALNECKLQIACVELNLFEPLFLQFTFENFNESRIDNYNLNSLIDDEDL